MSPMTFCLQCGEISARSHCEECRPAVRKEQRGERKPDRSRGAGYNTAWDRLSRKARKLQPFCLDCGATEDLQLDHTPLTWERWRQRKPIRLQHTGGVVCSDCNRARGDARTPGGEGYTGPPRESGPVGQNRYILPTSNIEEGGENG